MPLQRKPHKIDSQRIAIAYVAIEEFCRRHVRRSSSSKQEAVRITTIRFSVCVQGYEASGHYVVDKAPINFNRKPPPKSKTRLRAEAHRREVEAHERHVARLHKERERRLAQEEKDQQQSSRRRDRLFKHFAGGNNS